MPDYRELWMRSMLRKTEEGARCKKCGPIDERFVTLALAPADFETEVAVCKECGSRVTLPASVRKQLEESPRQQKEAGEDSLAWRKSASQVDSSRMICLSQPVKIADADEALTGAATALPPAEHEAPMPALAPPKRRAQPGHARVVETTEKDAAVDHLIRFDEKTAGVLGTAVGGLAGAAGGALGGLLLPVGESALRGEDGYRDDNISAHALMPSTSSVVDGGGFDRHVSLDGAILGDMARNAVIGGGVGASIGSHLTREQPVTHRPVISAMAPTMAPEAKVATKNWATEFFEKTSGHRFGHGAASFLTTDPLHAGLNAMAYNDGANSVSPASGSNISGAARGLGTSIATNLGILGGGLAGGALGYGIDPTPESAALGTVAGGVAGGALTGIPMAHYSGRNGARAATVEALGNAELARLDQKVATKSWATEYFAAMA